MWMKITQSNNGWIFESAYSLLELSAQAYCAVRPAARSGHRRRGAQLHGQFGSQRAGHALE